MRKLNCSKRSLVAFEQINTLVAVVELSLSSWLVGGIVPGLGRDPQKKLEPDPALLLGLLERWKAEAIKKGQVITRICVAYEAGRDGFWLARWLRERGIEPYVIHPTSIPVAREHRRAKTDRLDVGLLKRSFLGWLRGEPDHCSMATIPTLEEEDLRRPTRERAILTAERTRIVNRMKSALVRLGVRNFKPTLRKAPERLAEVLTPEGVPIPPRTADELRRDMTRLRMVDEQIKTIEKAREDQLAQARAIERAALEQRRQAVAEQAGELRARLLQMILQLSQLLGVGLETAEVLVVEVLSRNLQDRHALARYVGLTGAPDESGSKRREKGLAKAGNARVRRVLIELAWRWVRWQPGSALTQWFVERTQCGRKDIRKKMIVALARKLIISLWQYATTGVALEGVVLRPAA
jgi:transposase